ncbi:putative acetyltransferase [Desulfitobacterium dichloroeliminans LMG P-21439]|uniref:Putative acetyltransferase n=1 Tax=Desulfitobacterium dichloroeliminans (strain LMG P-21439 / DCA1) TaxID=871963 RepID=L0F5C1_DESDL|nr:N-acetyltransferase [Desulfitobacterium dichloroeliminans]AGA68240.1 putative acetyltransferase [Desulfitobacterium dichloroeliminans LMG P-21439]
MKITIRQETKRDYQTTEDIVKKAFKDAEYSDQKEQFLVSRLRNSKVFVPELSLIGEVDGEFIGHIMLTKLIIENDEREYETLALAPVSVLPEYQNKGIGSKMINEGLRIAKELGFKSVIVLGHEKYYPRFGFRPASRWNIKAPFDVPDESFMALELETGSLAEVIGTVVYPQEFFE